MDATLEQAMGDAIRMMWEQCVAEEYFEVMLSLAALNTRSAARTSAVMYYELLHGDWKKWSHLSFRNGVSRKWLQMMGKWFISDTLFTPEETSAMQRK